MTFRSLSLAIALMAAAPVTLTACGPKKPTGDEEAVNPRQAFLNGVQILQTPNKDGEIDYQAAYLQFTAASDAKPDYAKAHFNAGFTAERMGNFDNAVTHYRAALNADGNYTAALFALGNSFSRMDRGMEAVELYKGWVEANPTDLTGRNALMEAQIAANLAPEAIEQARLILLEDSKNVGAYRNLSRAYFSQGKYEMSQLCAEKAKTLAEGDAGIYNNIGVTYLVMNDEPAAIEEFKTARKLDPDNTEANLNLGYVALSSGDYILAGQAFDAALKGEPGNLDARLGKAVALRGTKQYEDAAKLYDEILANNPNRDIAYFNAAALYEKYLKDYKKADKILGDFVDKNAGSLTPDHKVFLLRERIKESQTIEEERKREEERKAKEAEERKKRQLAKLEELKAKVATLQAIIDKYGECEMMVEMGGAEMGMMVLEQAQMVVEAEEADMAADVMTFVDEIMPQLEMIIPECESGAAAPAPEGGDTPPAEGGDAAPAEGTDAPPAEGGE